MIKKNDIFIIENDIEVKKGKLIPSSNGLYLCPCKVKWQYGKTISKQGKLIPYITKLKIQF